MKFSKTDTKIIKGIAICFMLWHHLFGAPMRLPANSFVSLFTINGNQFATVIAMFCKICVSLFTFLSGYGIYKSSSIKGCSSKFIYAHLLSLYKYVWIIFIIALPYSVYMHIDYGSEIIYESIYNFLGLKATINREWWFIAPYAMLLMAFPMIRKVLDKTTNNFFSDFFVIIIISAFCNYLLQPITEFPIMEELRSSILWDNFNHFLGLLPAFLLGNIIAKHDVLSQIKRNYSGRLIYCIIALICMLAIFVLRFRNANYDYINAAILIICIVILIPTKPMQQLSKLLVPLGENSTAMWLVHSFFCYYLYPPAVYFLKYPILIFVWLLILSYISARGITIILKLIESRIGNHVKQNL